MGLRDLAIHLRQFSVMADAGVGLPKILSLLSAQGESKELRNAWLGVSQKILAGQPLGKSMSLYPEAFPSLVVSAIRTAELSGTVPCSFMQLANYYEKEYYRIQKIRAALVYPACVFSVAVLCILVIFGYIFPTFSQFLADTHVHLPLVTRVLLVALHWAASPLLWMLSLLGAALAYLGWRSRMMDPNFAVGVNELQLRLPIVGHLTANLFLIRYLRSLSTMLATGVNSLAALEALWQTATLPFIKLLTAEIYERTKQGMNLSQSMKGISIFPDFILHLVKSGEETGSLEEMLSKGADYLETEVETLLQNLTALIEPALIIGLGIIVGAVLIGFFAPFYAAIGTLQ